MEKVKQFVFNAILAENALTLLEPQVGFNVHGGSLVPPTISVDDMGFSPRILYDAQKMASVFTAFYCLENSVRDLITERLLDRLGPDWWDKSVPNKIQDAVKKLQDKESKNPYHSARSSALIGYTLFGNLAQIIIAKWDEFSDLFPNQAWVLSRFNDLEMSRNIIMHTGALPQIEIDRIQSIVRDWIRQVG